MPDPHVPEPSDEEIAELERLLESKLEDEPIDPLAQAQAEMEAKVAAAAKTDLPEPPDDAEFAHRVREITGKASIEEVRAEALKTAKSEDMTSVYKGTATGLQLAYALLGMPLAGLAIGYLLDGADGTTWKGILSLAGAVIGIGYVIWRTSGNKGDS